MANKKRVEIKMAKNLQYYFVVIGSNNKIIATSETYIKRSGCMNGIDALAHFFKEAMFEHGEGYKVVDTTTAAKGKHDGL